MASTEDAHWVYDPDGMDWGIGAWKCSSCYSKNDNLGCSKDINPLNFVGSKYCPQCGKRMYILKPDYTYKRNKQDY